MVLKFDLLLLDDGDSRSYSSWRISADDIISAGRCNVPIFFVTCTVIISPRGVAVDLSATALPFDSARPLLFCFFFSP